MRPPRLIISVRDECGVLHQLYWAGDHRFQIVAPGSIRELDRRAAEDQVLGWRERLFAGGLIVDGPAPGLRTFFGTRELYEYLEPEHDIYHVRGPKGRWSNDFLDRYEGKLRALRERARLAGLLT